MGKIISGLDCVTPFKRKPGKDLTPEQRAYNKAHSRVRIRVENDIRRVKIFRIMKERYRNRRFLDKCGRQRAAYLNRIVRFQSPLLTDI